MDYISYCKTALNITNIDDCAGKVAEGNQKVWIIYISAYLVFALLQILITGAFSKKKGAGFWLGIIGYQFIMVLIIIIFMILMPQLLILAGVV